MVWLLIGLGGVLYVFYLELRSIKNTLYDVQSKLDDIYPDKEFNDLFKEK